jgi:hypothetical protein
MPALTRSRSPDHREDWWEIYYGDIHASTITERVGNPHDTEPWGNGATTSQRGNESSP